MKHLLGRLGIVGQCLLGAIALSCAQAAPDDGLVASKTSAIYMSNGTVLWNDNNWGTGVSIPVCFTVAPQTGTDGRGHCSAETNRNLDCLGQSLLPDPDSLRNVVRTNVENTWMRYGNVEFYGWGDCPIDSGSGTHLLSAWPGIMVRFSHVDTTVEDATDYSWGEGKQSGGATLIQYNSPAIYNNGKLNGDLGNVVHEFGHALGFHHEWERQDWNHETCYGEGEVRSAVPGKCLDVRNGATGNGTPVQSYSCNGTEPQHWKFENGTITALGKCLDVSNSGTANGTLVQLWDCNGTGAQQWVPYTNSALRNPNSGRCLAIPNGSAADGVQLQIWDCNGTDSQRWGVTAGDTLDTQPDQGSIMQYCLDGGTTGQLTAWDIVGLQVAYGRKYRGSLVGYRGQCANVQGGATASGTSIIAFPCRGQWNDTWFRVSGSTLEQFQTPSNSRCMNVYNATAPNRLVSRDCVTAESERFTTLGVEWRGMGNMCVQAVGSALQLQTCNGSSAQKWDFFHPVGLRADQIRRNGTNSCVSASTTSGALGQSLTLATCSSTDTKQRFSFPGSGLVALSNNTGLCANVSGGAPTAGSPIILWDGCVTGNPPHNSQFTASGKIRTLNNCMTIQNTANPGDLVAASACTSSNSTTQVWEYYF